MSKITKERLSVMSVQYCQYSFEYYVESMVKCGIKWVDFWGGLPHYYRLDYDQAGAQKKVEEIRGLLDKNDLGVAVYTPETLNYPYSFTDPAKETRDRTVDFFELAMKDAKILGTDKVFLNSGCGLRDVPRDVSFDRLIDSYKRIADLAEKYEIDLVLEQLQPYESNLVLALPDLQRVLDGVNSKRMKVCVDLVAMEVAGENLSQWFDALGNEMIKLIHFSDTYHYILGDGELPLKSYLKTLEDYDYQGIVDLEINDSIYWLDPHSSIEKSVDWFEKEWK